MATGDMGRVSQEKAGRRLVKALEHRENVSSCFPRSTIEAADDC